MCRSYNNIIIADKTVQLHCTLHCTATLKMCCSYNNIIIALWYTRSFFGQPETSTKGDVRHSRQEVDCSFINAHHLSEGAPHPKEQYNTLVLVGGRNSFEFPTTSEGSQYAQLHESKYYSELIKHWHSSYCYISCIQSQLTFVWCMHTAEMWQDWV